MTEVLEAPAFDKIDEKAQELCNMLARAIGEADEAVFDYDYEGRVEQIESEPRSGFWPWTSGGYHVVLPASLAHLWSTGSYNEDGPLGRIIESTNELIADEWARQYPERPKFIDCICAEPGTSNAEFQEAAYDWEQEGWQADDSCYFWKARVMFYSPEAFGYKSDEAPEPGEPYVYIDAYLNTDLDYGRDEIRWLSCYGSNPNQTVGDFKRFYSVSQFAALTDEELEALVNEAVESLP